MRLRRREVRIRCSALPRVLACPASKEAPELLIDRSTPEALTGQCVHRVMADIVKSPQTLAGVPELEPYLKEFPGVDPEDVKRICWNGFRLWQKFAELVFVDDVECPLRGSTLEGHADVLGHTVGDQVVVMDWKTGRVERDYEPQVKGYLALACEYRFKTPAGAKAVVVWLRQRDRYDVYDYDLETLDAFRRSVLDALDAEHYNPGEHCEFCPLQFECTARTAMVRQSIAMFEEGSAIATPEALARAYPAYQIAHKALEGYHSLLKQTLKEHPGGLVLDDGRTLSLQPQTQAKVRFGAELVVQVANLLGLSERYALEALESCTTVSKGSLEQMVKTNSPPRAGGKNLLALYAGLTTAGMIEEKVVEKISLKMARDKEDG